MPPRVQDGFPGREPTFPALYRSPTAHCTLFYTQILQAFVIIPIVTAFFYIYY